MKPADVRQLISMIYRFDENSIGDVLRMLLLHMNTDSRLNNQAAARLGWTLLLPSSVPPSSSDFTSYGGTFTACSMAEGGERRAGRGEPVALL